MPAMFVYPSATGAFPPGNRDGVLVFYNCRLEFDEESFPEQRKNPLAKDNSPERKGTNLNNATRERTIDRSGRLKGAGPHVLHNCKSDPVYGALRLFLLRMARTAERLAMAPTPPMDPKITASPRTWGKPRTLCGPTVIGTVEVADSPKRSVTVAVIR